MPKNLKFEDDGVYTNIGLIGIDTVEGEESRWIPIDEALDHVDLERIGITENGVYTGAFSEVTVAVQNAIGTKRITRNGTFHASDDNLDGYSDVTVNVPINYDPNVGVKHVSTNGTYNASSDNLDGFNRVFVNVQPNVSSKSISSNGTYSASSDNKDGYSEVTVNVQPNVSAKTITENGTYSASSDNKDGYSEVTVNVNAEPDLMTKTINANGTFNASSDNVDGYSEVTVNVQPNVGSKSISSNGTYTASSENKDGYSEVTVNVQPSLQSKTVTQNGTVTPDSGYYGLSNVSVNVQPNVGSKTITENGTYNASSDNLDGYSSVIVATQEAPELDVESDGSVILPSTGGSSTKMFPGFYEIYFGGLNDFTVSVTGLSIGVAYSDLSTSEKNYYDNYRYTNQSKITKTITSAIATSSLEDFISLFSSGIEYSGVIYDNSNMINDLGLVLLGDYSQTGSANGNVLSDSISNYSGVILQGIYRNTRTSGYNTSMLYHAPKLNTSYWAGMKDRNSSYDCGVIFTDNSTVSLTGNRQVIIYGIP